VACINTISTGIPLSMNQLDWHYLLLLVKTSSH